ncbi:MAG: hypothetical protein E6H48_13720 [Betaproteobacteria bacterium]|nr:MAG: hypothetical protein E6H48_13720 [Betaproteobacteria bacterium]
MENACIEGLLGYLRERPTMTDHAAAFFGIGPEVVKHAKPVSGHIITNEHCALFFCPDETNAKNLSAPLLRLNGAASRHHLS